jgi:hypothetical protein
MSLTWTDHQGKRILVNDFKGLDEPAALAQLDEEVALLERTPEPVRMLVDLSGAPIMMGFVARARELAPRIEQRLEKQAVLGITGVKSMLLTGFNLVSSGVPLRPFPDEGTAKDYLVR